VNTLFAEAKRHSVQIIFPVMKIRMTLELDRDTVEKAYTRWAPVYDLVFGAVFDQGRQLAIAAANRIGGQILDVGVGTGVSLPEYSASCRISAVDFSAAMLRKARQRVTEQNLTNVETLDVMDAESLSFADDSFDAVVAMHVISTVPHPEVALDECARVLRPGGEMILISRVGADAGMRHIVERLLQPIVRYLGWRTAFSWEVYAGWIARRDDIRLVERRPVPPFGHFSLIRFVKSAAAGKAKSVPAGARAPASEPALQPLR
jgi:phosphatidylethanolamine/phosphatidyl-N-methylethanolamine N-methyltransferase